MKAVPGILPTLLEMIYFFSTPTIDVEPNETKKGHNQANIVQNACLLKEHLAEMCIENKRCPSYNDSIVNCGF